MEHSVDCPCGECKKNRRKEKVTPTSKTSQNSPGNKHQ
jgi:hypothetical protein